MQEDALDNLLGSRTRAGVLRTLFDGRLARLSLHDLARAVRVTPMTARRELLALVKLGVLTVTREANRTLYQANPSHPLASVFRQLVVRAGGAAEVREDTAAYGTPVCHVVAGPNGAGKSSFALDYLPGYAPGIEYVNPDLMAQGFSPTDISRAALHAGRLVFERIDALAAAQEDFGFETTLSGTAYLRRFAALRAAGYRIDLYYLWIAAEAVLPPRIRHRVMVGGHDVPDDDVLRRFERSRANLSRYLPLIGTLRVFDASPLVPELIYARSPSGEEVVDAARCRIMRKELGI